MAWAVLKITDGTTANTVNLLAVDTGWHLKYWKPATAVYKDGGVWVDNAMSDGRRLSMRRLSNIVETMETSVVGHCFDSTVYQLRKLRVLFEKAADYWEQAYNNTPIYIVAKALHETNTRYAVIYTGVVPEDADIGDPTFIRDAVANGITVSLEHMAWQDVAPGSSSCVQLSSQSSAVLPTATYASPVASMDDVHDDSVNLVDIAACYMGDISGSSYDAGIRFTNVVVPVGAVINRAHIELYAENTNNVTVCNLRIYGEDEDNPAIFTDRANFIGRTKTTAFVDWSAVGVWAAGAVYTTVDIKTIIQEIVNRIGWVSGNHLVIFIDNNASDWGAHRDFSSITGSYTPARLVIEYTTSTTTLLGSAATCANEVYVANKHTETSMLTDVYHHDASTDVYSVNLLGTTLPFNLFPNPIGDDDALYIGVAFSADTGVFNSAVLDIGTAAVYGGAATVTFQYYHTDTTWHTLPVITTSGSATKPFTATGVQSVHFKQPNDWQHVAVNGVDCWWIRIIANIAGGDSISVPTQANRYLYTVVMPCVDIAATQLGGDISVATRVVLQNASTYVGNIHAPQRVLLASRATSRGVSYTPFIYPGVNGMILVPSFGGSSALVTGSWYPRYYACDYTPAGVDIMRSRMEVYIPDTHASSYVGKFRAYLVASAGATAAVFNARLSIQTMIGGIYYTVYSTDKIAISAYGLAANYECSVNDLGEIDLPPYGLTSPAGGFGYNITVDTDASAAGTLTFLTLILWPVDEYVADIIETADRQTSLLQAYLLDVDNVSIPKLNGIHAYVKPGYYPLPTMQWQSIGKAFVLKPNIATRLWFLRMRAYSIAHINDWLWDVSVADTIQMYKVQHYLSFRGAG